MSRPEADLKYQELIAACDLMIKSGKMDQAIATISDLVVSQVPRSARQGLAKCCRRSGLIGVGLRLLHPVIRGEKIFDEPAYPTEICEYAALLARNGSIQEALQLLKDVDVRAAPEALLYQGQCHILSWEYAEAVEFFERFLASSGDEYSKLVARVNLISGYIVLFRLDEATAVLEETVAFAEKTGATRLLANCYELWGQVYFWQKDFSAARRMLHQATEIFSHAQSFDLLLIRKTEAIMAAIEENSIVPLKQFRKLAIERKNWESVREADLFILKVAPNQRQLDHLIFGTARIPYRRRIEALVEASPSRSYVLGSDDGPQLNLQTGLLQGGTTLPIGKKIHQVISTLNQDFYSPINIGTLFYELYPDEYFNIDSSPFRVRQAILRTRQWLADAGLPASVQQSHGAYRFQITGEFGIRIELDQSTINPTEVRWRQLKESFAPNVAYTSEQICLHLNWSRSTFRRLADWACANGHLQRFGTGKATTYQIVTARAEGPRRRAA